jgi:hypothetical protein
MSAPAEYLRNLSATPLSPIKTTSRFLLGLPVAAAW